MADSLYFDEDEANMRFGIGDVNLDTIEVHSIWDPVIVDILFNVGENDVEVLLIADERFC